MTRVLVAMFSVNQHVSGSSAKRSVSSRRKPPEKKKLKGALVSVASKNWFTVLDAVSPLCSFDLLLRFLLSLVLYKAFLLHDASA